MEIQSPIVIYYLTFSYSSEGSPALARSVQPSLITNCRKLTSVYLDFLTTYFLFLCGDIVLKKDGSNICLIFRPQSVFTAFRALLPSANYSAE
jgi:hypothetical protein